MNKINTHLIQPEIGVFFSMILLIKINIKFNIKNRSDSPNNQNRIYSIKLHNICWCTSSSQRLQSLPYQTARILNKHNEKKINTPNCLWVATLSRLKSFVKSL